jgi:IMP dehydrogenase/GMP reductase
MSMVTKMKKAYSFDEILIKPNTVSDFKSRKDVESVYCGQYPIIAANMDGLGNLKVASMLQKHGFKTALVKETSLEELYDYYATDNSLGHNFNTQSAIPTFSPYDIDKYKKILDFCQKHRYHKPKLIQIDVANGHILDHLLKLHEFLEVNKEANVIYGNLGNVDDLTRIYNQDQLKRIIFCLGIGSGSLCKTRFMTGVGVPQATLCLQGKKLGIDFVSDGGIRSPGDVVKALYLGASYVMIGSLFMRTKEIVGRQAVYGSSSFVAKEKPEYSYSEGAVVAATDTENLPSLDEVCRMIKAGIHSAGTYLGMTFPNRESYKDIKKNIYIVNKEQSDPAREFWKDFNVTQG